ncbi:hypothetical protein SAMN05216360_10336 [Methylobacterium phyllostachyos]|uniref:Uncharacterized protein n=1 Tax=Methylobacterium phyllostachyos TaxID=582672 RepID=A0A1G9V256_9HYPH|nr:hypothetical protein [Methylobacterium phyllostachyos]SDM65965.1 hypothetical protein SAMN05216360_10336 [Methylobacterium phyllostachyos]
MSAAPAAYADDWTGAALATRRLPNPVLAVEVSPAADALAVRLRDGTTCVLRAPDIGPLAPGGDARDAIRQAVVRACQQHQRTAA